MIDYSQQHWNGVRPIDYGTALDRGMTEAQYLKAQRKAREEARQEAKEARQWLAFKIIGYAILISATVIITASVRYSVMKEGAVKCLENPSWCQLMAGK